MVFFLFLRSILALFSVVLAVLIWLLGCLLSILLLGICHILREKCTCCVLVLVLSRKCNESDYGQKEGKKLRHMLLARTFCTVRRGASHRATKFGGKKLCTEYVNILRTYQQRLDDMYTRIVDYVYFAIPFL